MNKKYDNHKKAEAEQKAGGVGFVCRIEFIAGGNKNYMSMLKLMQLSGVDRLYFIYLSTLEIFCSVQPVSLLPQFNSKCFLMHLILIFESLLFTLCSAIYILKDSYIEFTVGYAVLMCSAVIILFPLSMHSYSQSEFAVDRIGGGQQKMTPFFLGDYFVLCILDYCSIF